MPNKSNPPTQPPLRHPLPPRPVPLDTTTNNRLYGSDRPRPFYIAPAHQPMGHDRLGSRYHLSPSSGPSRQQHQSRFFRTTAPYYYTNPHIVPRATPSLTGDRSKGIRLGNAQMGPNDNIRLGVMQGPPSANPSVAVDPTGYLGRRHDDTQAESRQAGPSGSMPVPKSASTGSVSPLKEHRWTAEEELEEGEIREGEVEAGKDEDEEEFEFDTISLGSE